MKFKTFFSLLTAFVFLFIALFFNYKSKKPVQSVAIMQILPHPSLDKIRNGIIETLKKNNPSIDIKYQNAQGNMPISMQTAQKFVNEDPELLIAIETPSALNAYKAAKGKDIPIVFAAVTDPVSVGLAKSLDQPLPMITGISDAIDHKQQIQFIKKLFDGKKIKRIGTIYNLGEQNSVSQVESFEKELKSADISLSKVTISNSSDIVLAMKKLITNVDVVVVFNDNMVVSGIVQLIKLADEHNVPVITTDPESIKLGALAALAYDQFHIGVQAAHLALGVMKNKDRKQNIPIQKAQKTFCISQ